MLVKKVNTMSVKKSTSIMLKKMHQFNDSILNAMWIGISVHTMASMKVMDKSQKNLNEESVWNRHFFLIFGFLKVLSKVDKSKALLFF